MSNKIRILLVFIVGLAFGLRLYGVWDNPPALSWDEVSIGYNAYSILKTGKDEHGRFLPFDTFVAYGDYKPPFAVYATVPFVGIFGLNELAVRLPSAIAGTLAVLLTYLLVIELLQWSEIRNPKHEIRNKFQAPNSKFKTILNFEYLNFDIVSNFGFRVSSLQAIAFLSALLLAISPWHINISRAGFEANIALFFIVLGVYLILRSKVRPKLWTICWLPFAVAIYTFNSSRYFTPIFSIGLIVYMYAEIKKNFRLFSVGVVIALIAVAPLLPHIMSKEARLRFAEVNIFTDASIVNTANERIAREGNSLLSKALNNRRVGYAYSMLTHYMDHFDPIFLFIRGDGNPKFSTQDVGQLYLIEAPLLVIGIIMMFSYNVKVALFLLFWLLASIIPAATARETPHALRILNSLPTWQIFVVYGLFVCIHKIVRIYQNNYRVSGSASTVRRFASLFTVFGVLTIYVFQITYYIYNYHIHYPRIYASEWQYGYKQAIEYVKEVYSAYDYIFITDRIGRPYMYTLFYTQYNPRLYFGQKKSYFDAAGFYHVDSFDKYVFIKTLPTPIPSKSLIIGDPSWIGTTDHVLKKIMYPNGSDALVIYEHN